MKKNISIEWKLGAQEGAIEINNGLLCSISIAFGEGRCEGNKFKIVSYGRCRLNAIIEGRDSRAGKPLVSVSTKENSFSFFLEDVSSDYPMFVPSYGVLVTDANDLRSYEEVEKKLKARTHKTLIEQMESEDEESFESAAEFTKNIPVDICLGISRDSRIFTLGFHSTYNYTGFEQMDWIQPWYHCEKVRLPENNDKKVKYTFNFGHGLGCRDSINKRLEDGVLPILHADLPEGEITYKVTAFASLEAGELKKENIVGTHCLLASSHANASALSEQQREELKKMRAEQPEQTETTALFYRIEAFNTGNIPEYAWFTVPVPNGTIAPSNIDNGMKYYYDENTGFGTYDSSRVFCVAKLNGEAVPNQEMAVLVKPGKSAVLDIILPHTPISKKRAEALQKRDFEQAHKECADFWKEKIAGSALLSVPEKRIDEMLIAGKNHLEITSYGSEPDGSVASSVGQLYAPIGSESAPIILFYESVGLHDLARRSIQYFLDRQRENGFIQTFDTYMLETGSVLWLVGEHYRYTRDKEWILENKNRLTKSCDFLIEWADRNKASRYVKNGYGMLDGKCADPEDPYHAYMLNGYAYLGLSRIAEIFNDMGLERGDEISQKAEELKQNIRESFFENLAISPLVPLKDGSWCPTVAPWPEYKGPLCLFAQGGTCFTHAGIVSRDSQLGAIWLIYQEVLNPEEPVSKFLLDFYGEVMYQSNVVIGQPYYSRHPWVHLKRRETGSFLKVYYNCMSAMADRDTYTFREDTYPSAVHKTHEEGWFLMETRYMLYLEEGQKLSLLRGVPRRWMEGGKSIKLEDAACYFGHFSLNVNSRLEDGIIEAHIKFNDGRRPDSIELRLPHPEKHKPCYVKGGRYEEKHECVYVDSFTGEANILLKF